MGHVRRESHHRGGRAKKAPAGIGHQFRIGEAIVKVTQPRMPGYKLGIRFGRPDTNNRAPAQPPLGKYNQLLGP